MTDTEARPPRIPSPPVDVGSAPLGVVMVLVILFAMLLAVVVSALVWRVPPPKD